MSDELSPQERRLIRRRRSRRERGAAVAAAGRKSITDFMNWSKHKASRPRLRRPSRRGGIVTISIFAVLMVIAGVALTGAFAPIERESAVAAVSAQQVDANSDNSEIGEAINANDDAPISIRAIEGSVEDGSTLPYVVDIDENVYNRFKPDGIASTNVDDFRQEIIDFTARDPRGLFAYYSASPLDEEMPLSSVRDLVEGGRVVDGAAYSDLGRMAHIAWSQQWEQSEAVMVERIASTGYNTGASGSRVTYSPGVNGSNLSGFDIVYPDGTSHSVLARCGNVTGGRPPSGFTPGRTDDTPPPPRIPPPPEPPTPPVPPTPEPPTPPVPPTPEPPTPPVPPTPPTPPEEPKCTDGVCGTPDEGADQQPVQDNNPGHTSPTPGYDPGEAEHNDQQQGDPCAAGGCGHEPTESGTEVDGGSAPGGGATAPDEQPVEPAQPNPDHDGSAPSTNPDAGTGDVDETPASSPDDAQAPPAAEGDPLGDIDLS